MSKALGNWLSLAASLALLAGCSGESGTPTAPHDISMSPPSGTTDVASISVHVDVGESSREAAEWIQRNLIIVDAAGLDVEAQVGLDVLNPWIDITITDLNSGWHTLILPPSDLFEPFQSLDWRIVGELLVADFLIGRSEPGVRRFDRCERDGRSIVTLYFSESLVATVPVRETVEILDSNGDVVSCSLLSAQLLAPQPSTGYSSPLIGYDCESTDVRGFRLTGGLATGAGLPLSFPRAGDAVIADSWISAPETWACRTWIPDRPTLEGLRTSSPP